MPAKKSKFKTIARTISGAAGNESSNGTSSTTGLHVDIARQKVEEFDVSKKHYIRKSQRYCQ